MTVKHPGVSTETGTAPDAEGPLRRWARRKREVAREKQQAADEARRGAVSEEARDVRDSTGDASEPTVVEENVLADEDMPPLDSLDEDSDYSDFLSPGVSEALRRRALRKLFSSAVFNIPDGLDDYDDDFTSFQAPWRHRDIGHEAPGGDGSGACEAGASPYGAGGRDRGRIRRSRGRAARYRGR